MSTQATPTRDQVPSADKWNLSKLFESDEAWEHTFSKTQEMVPKIESFKGTLGDSKESLFACLSFMNDLELHLERLGAYSMLRQAEDVGSSESQGRYGRFVQLASAAEAAASYQRPELLTIPDEAIDGFMGWDQLADYRVMLRKILRFKPHTLSAAEERLIAMQTEANQTARKSFGALTDVDMDFGTVQTEQGERPLTQSTLGFFMLQQDREVRQTAYRQFLAEFAAHKNTLAALYSGSVALDVYQARSRNFPNARAAALFADDVPESVYDSLIRAVHDNFDVLHKYYKLRTKLLGQEKLYQFDRFVPLVKEVTVEHPYEKAVDTIAEALAPLGEEYTSTLYNGLLKGWVDRYETKGKRSGGFSAGTYVGEPYILMNYKPDVMRDLFTLAHEGGHSMHSWYSVAGNPFQHYRYTIFEAEVASTFNEQLLHKKLLEEAKETNLKAYLINKHIDDIISTLFRQTMFAEYEHKAHRMAEEGVPLTVDSLRGEYRKLLEAYFGPDAALEENDDMEGLRIPHFYRAFYVYKYATGLSAAITLSERVLTGGKSELEDYFGFLKSGGSRFPVQSLQHAGVDVTTPAPVEKAMEVFGRKVDELASLLS